MLGYFDCRDFFCFYILYGGGDRFVPWGLPHPKALRTAYAEWLPFLVDCTVAVDPMSNDSPLDGCILADDDPIVMQDLGLTCIIIKLAYSIANFTGNNIYLKFGNGLVA